MCLSGLLLAVVGVVKWLMYDGCCRWLLLVGVLLFLLLAVVVNWLMHGGCCCWLVLAVCVVFVGVVVGWCCC